MNISPAKINLTMMTGATKHLYPYNSYKITKIYNWILAYLLFERKDGK